MLNTFAHAGETHEAVTQSTAHRIMETWYYSLPLFLLLVLVVAFIVFKLTKGSYAATYNVVLGVMFFAGVLTYTLSAPISIVALSIGFAMALFSVVTMLGTSSK